MAPGMLLVLLGGLWRVPAARAAAAPTAEQRPAAPATAAALREAYEERDEDEGSCLLTTGASIGRALATRHLAANATSAQTFRSFPACFRAVLRPNPVTAPLTPEAPLSRAVARLRVTQTQVHVSMDWVLPGVSPLNPVIGLHVHKADRDKDGPILVGFCGLPPQPMFRGICAQSPVVKHYRIRGAVQEGTLRQAARELAWSHDPENSFYVQVHTASSFVRSRGESLGLIRGQLRRVKCH